MRIHPGWGSAVNTLAAMLIAVGICQTQSTQLSSASTPEANAKPLVLEKNEGELRVRRMPADNTIPISSPTSQFMLKVSPKNNGSHHLVLGTEELPPGALIRTHKHMAQDEILLIQTGTAHVRLGDQERDVHAGGLVFIPANTWVRFKNTGSEPISLVFIFSAPGFEDYMRCTSVPEGQKGAVITREELKICAHGGHVVYEELEEPPKN
jgi:mannose-6-phosphate isomerase-like protein (cupin superfamily)